MSKLKSYSCSKCGAVLSVDKLQGQMACPFCGNEFDYVDFHRDDLIRQADECLARGAFDAAREKFDKVLENDPADIEAYRGQVLCAGKVRSTEDMQNLRNLNRYDHDAIKKIVSSAKDKVTEEEFDYLNKLLNLFELSTIREDVKDRKEEVVGLERKHHDKELFKEDRRGCLAYIIMFFGILLIPVFCMLFVYIYFGLTNFFEDPKHIVFYFSHLSIMAAVVIIPLIFFCWLAKKNERKELEVPQSSYRLNRQIENIEELYSNTLSEVLEFETAFRKKPEEKAIKREGKPRDPGAQITTNVICAKCGGQLKLNADQELYECNSCGVSYGKYLFFGDLTANAVKAMDMGEFDEADQILSHKLKMNPKDFESLFGRFLCAGRWKRLNDIDLSDRASIARAKKLPAKLDALEKSISAEDQPHWEDIRNLASIMTEYAAKRAEYNRVNDTYNSVCNKIEKTYLMQEELEQYKARKDELFDNRAALERECSEITIRLDKAAMALTGAVGSCVFF